MVNHRDREFESNGSSIVGGSFVVDRVKLWLSRAPGRPPTHQQREKEARRLSLSAFDHSLKRLYGREAECHNSRETHPQVSLRSLLLNLEVKTASETVEDWLRSFVSNREVDQYRAVIS